MPYGNIFLESLPRYRVTNEVADVARFLDGGGKQKAANPASPA
jgi:hypothetical protein